VALKIEESLDKEAEIGEYGQALDTERLLNDQQANQQAPRLNVHIN